MILGDKLKSMSDIPTCGFPNADSYPTCKNFQSED